MTPTGQKRRGPAPCAALIVTANGRPCTLDTMLHAKGVLVPAEPGEEIYRLTREEHERDPLRRARRIAQKLIERTVNHRDAITGSMVSELPRARRLIQATDYQIEKAA